MILINDLGKNICVRYNGYDIQQCQKFTQYMISVKAYKKNKGAEWILSKDYLDKLITDFEYEMVTHPWDNMGAKMKLTPYPYQKEAIYYTLNNPNSLLILPPGSGNFFLFTS